MNIATRKEQAMDYESLNKAAVAAAPHKKVLSREEKEAQEAAIRIKKRDHLFSILSPELERAAKEALRGKHKEHKVNINDYVDKWYRGLSGMAIDVDVRNDLWTVYSVYIYEHLHAFHVKLKYKSEAGFFSPNYFVYINVSIREIND